MLSEDWNLNEWADKGQLIEPCVEGQEIHYDPTQVIPNQIIQQDIQQITTSTHQIHKTTEKRQRSIKNSRRCSQTS